MTDMGKEELLERLKDMYEWRYPHGDDSQRGLQAHTQLVKIVEEYFDSEKAEPQVVDEEKKIEEIRMMIQKATSEYMPVFRRIILNDAVEVEIRKLLTQQKREVTREEIRETVRYLEMATDPISAEGALEEKLKELGMEVEEAEEEREQEPMDKETAADMEFHRLKDEGRLDRFGRRKDGT